MDERERERLGEEAAAQVRSLGEKTYPVLVCSTCFKLTGWLGSGGRCETCIDEELRRAEYADPSGGWVDVSGGGSQPAGPLEDAPSGWKRAAAAVGWRGPLNEERVAIWMKHVDPGETGPVDPEDGFNIAVADRTEGAAPEGADLLVRFFVRSLTFDGGSWTPVV